EEWQIMRNHTVIGARLISAVPSLLEVGAIVRASHERWDGAGYPDRLSGPDIPLCARIVTVCDAYDAMTSNRPYRQGITSEAAIEEIRLHSGTQFDPDVAATLLDVLRHRNTPQNSQPLVETPPHRSGATVNGAVRAEAGS